MDDSEKFLKVKNSVKDFPSLSFLLEDMDEKNIISNTRAVVVEGATSQKVLNNEITTIFTEIFLDKDVIYTPFYYDVYNTFVLALKQFLLHYEINEKIYFVFKGGNVMRESYNKSKNESNKETYELLGLDDYFKKSDYDFCIYVGDKDNQTLDDSTYYKLLDVLGLPVITSLQQISEKYENYYNNSENIYTHNNLLNFFNKFRIKKNDLKDQFFHKEFDSNNIYILDSDDNINFDKKLSTYIGKTGRIRNLENKRLIHYISFNKSINNEDVQFYLARIRAGFKHKAYHYNLTNKIYLNYDSNTGSYYYIKYNRIVPYHIKNIKNINKNGMIVNEYTDMDNKKFYIDNNNNNEIIYYNDANLSSEFVDISMQKNYLFKDIKSIDQIKETEGRFENNVLSDDDIIYDIIYVLMFQRGYLIWEDEKYEKRIQRLLYFLSKKKYYDFLNKTYNKLNIEYDTLEKNINVVVNNNYCIIKINDISAKITLKNIEKYKTSTVNIEYDDTIFNDVEKTFSDKFFDVILIYDDTYKSYECNKILSNIFILLTIKIAFPFLLQYVSTTNITIENFNNELKNIIDYMSNFSNKYFILCTDISENKNKETTKNKYNKYKIKYMNEKYKY